ncbi:hypothetical protein COBT_002534, partial [Conglomerata obtusa]
MTKKITSVILIGPSSDLFPLSNADYPNFILPILNEPILSFNIKWISPISEKIIIIGLDTYHEHIKQIIDGFINDNIIFCSVSEYEGTFQTIVQIKDKIETDDVLIFKGDIFTNIDAVILLEYYTQNKSSALAFFSENNKTKNKLCAYKDNELLYYTENMNSIYEINSSFFIDHKEVNFTTSYELMQIYIFKKDVLEYVPDGFSLKNEIFPALVNHYRTINPIKMMIVDKGYFFQIKKKDSYLKANNIQKSIYNYPLWSEDESLESKGAIFEFFCKRIKRVSFKDQEDSRKTVVAFDFKLYDGVVIFNTAIGKNVTIDCFTKIGSSIIMEGAIIGKNCVLERCVIGINAFIPDDCELNGCIISCGYKFSDVTKAYNKNFT